MNKQQREFLHQFMDDYQIKKFDYLVNQGKISLMRDMMVKRQSYKNIDMLEEDFNNFKRFYEKYNLLNKTNLVNDVEEEINNKKKLLKSIFSFVREDKDKLREEYNKCLNETNQNFNLNKSIFKIEENINNTKEKYVNYTKKSLKTIKILYIILICGFVLKTAYYLLGV